MSNLEVVGSLMLYIRFSGTSWGAEAIREAVIQAEGEGNVVVDIIPVYEGAITAAVAVFLKVAGSTRNSS